MTIEIGFDIPQRFLRESAVSYLEPDERVIAADFWLGHRGIQNEPTAPGVTLVRGRMGVLMTQRRLLIFSTRGVGLNKANELLTDLPLDQVESIEGRPHWLKSFEAILTVQGIQHTMRCAHASHTRVFGEVLEAVKQGEEVPGWRPDSGDTAGSATCRRRGRRPGPSLRAPCRPRASMGGRRRAGSC